jgi:hypothetical protein
MRSLWWSVIVACGLSACSGAGSETDGTAEPAADGDAPGVADAGYDSTPSPDAGLGVLSFSPERSFSGFDGEHAYQVPIAVYDAADDLLVAVKDPSSASIAKTRLASVTRADGTFDSGRYFLVTMKRAGTITIVAESRGRKVEASVEVASYDANAWRAGEGRYLNAGATGDPACAQCHSGSQGIDHSPAAMASASDEQLKAVVTTGISIAGFPITEATKGHRWDVSEQELDGVVTYLRGLPPRGFE